MDHMYNDAAFEVSNDISASDTQSILAEILGKGNVTPKFVRIFTHAKLDTSASHEAKRRIYKELPFILVRYTHDGDGVSRPVTAADKRLYPKEWDRYESTLKEAKDPDVSLLPAATLSATKELSDMGIVRISALIARAKDIPDHLKPVLDQAKIWEQLNASPTEAEEDTDGV